MKIAVISDTHLGDPLCTLVEQKGSDFTAGVMYDKFKDASGSYNDYLVLLGDILDFSVATYENAYKAGKAFFSLIKEDSIADQIIYVPGNHDYDIWSVVEYEVNIIYQIKNGRLPRKFRMAVPGIIDDRKNSPHRGFTLPGVDRRTNGIYSYGGLFFDSITKNYVGESNSLEGKDSHFVFAYPDIYLVNDDESVLMTHGQYLESYWSLLSEWAPRIFKSDITIGSEMDIAELVGLNFPFNQLACSGVGQAGALSDVISRLQSQIKKGDIENTKEYLDNLDDYLDKNVFDYNKWYQFIDEAITDLISNKVKEKVVDLIASQKDTRYDEKFFDSPDVRKRLLNYYKACLAELNNLRSLHNVSVPVPEKILFGHTHRPIAWLDKNVPELTVGENSIVKLYNTGGWLWKEEGSKKVFCGAEVFKYETGSGFRSVSIR